MRRQRLIWMGVLALVTTALVFFVVSTTPQKKPSNPADGITQPLSNNPPAFAQEQPHESPRNPGSPQTANNRLESILASKSRLPHRAALRQLTLNDEEALLKEYHQTINITDLRSLTWALAAVGGDAAAAVLQQSLTDGRSDPEIDYKEFGILHNHLLALGFISARSDVAYHFLTEATQADYWRTHRVWHRKEPEMDEIMNQEMASLAISSLGLSGRDDVESRLENLKQQPLSTLKEIRSGLMSGAFRAELAAEIGHQALLELWVSSLDAMLERYVQWQEHSLKGREWKKWSDDLIQAIAQENSAGGNQP